MPNIPWTEIAAAFGSLILISLRLCYSHLKKQLKSHNSEAVAKLEKIGSEFSNNGGSSLRDAIDRIEGVTVMNTGRIWAMMADDSSARWEADVKGECIYMNRTGMKWAGRSFAELRGRGWVNVIDPLDRARVVKEWFDAVRDGRSFESHYSWLDINNDPIPVSAVSHPLRDAKGVVTGWIGVCERREP
jgi:PAS domain S-box-containing protein